ncbi:hypothetical protein Golob_005577 [Gossypium lobatum]|uniref:Basic blue protein n=1 Tax=Gossypium lobatum TaxID=34289 RepID=A0A7J8MU30_9ROSI|nr:hypothetical protein [Gossypium lobatum]
MRRRAIIMVILMVLQFGAIHSKPTTYMVGDEDGWDSGLDMEGWTKGKTFHAGDFLVFTYDDQQFDVAVVNQTGHDSCTLNEGAKVFHSGNDKIQLAFGANYFIDTVADLCAIGMKMAINATAPPPSV